MSNVPTKPIESYEDAELPPVPPSGAEGEPPAPVESPEPEIAALEFLDPAAVSTDVPLKYPWRWQGKVVRSITVRRLGVAEVGKVAERLVKLGRFDRYEFYAAMTGFPADVIRALPDEDGEAVVEKARPFLPRIVREPEMTDPDGLTEEAATSPSTTPSPDGAATPSPPPAP